MFICMPSSVTGDVMVVVAASGVKRKLASAPST